MKVKRKLLATFVPNDKIEWFLDLLEIKYSINNNNVFIFKNLDDDTCIMTYSFSGDEFLNLNEFVYSTVIAHKKGDTIYTINALNKLIALESGITNGNIIHSNYKIDWNQYKAKLILIFNDKLIINDIKRIFP